MRAIIPAIALFALAACQPAETPESAGTDQGRVAVGPIISAEALEGVYRVASINDDDLGDLDTGFAVAITRDRIDVVENCVTTDWSYRFEGQQIVTAPIPGPTCRRALLPQETALIAALTGAQTVSRTPANGVLIEGSGGSVTLFSQ